ncbi:MAG: hypothetical protein ACR2G6_02990, partial [Gemmatimonadaceae bacterium]
LEQMTLKRFTNEEPGGGGEDGGDGASDQVAGSRGRGDRNTIAGTTIPGAGTRVRTSGSHLLSTSF